MTTRGSREDTDPDDWFDEPPVRDPWSVEAPGVDSPRDEATPNLEDWIADAGETGRVGPEPRRQPKWLVVAVVGLALAALLGVLAAAGVFSGARHGTVPPTASPTTEPARTTHTTPTSTQQESSVLPTAPLKPGNSGPEVKKLQRALALVGAAPGAIDGRYGSATTLAVTKFQRAHGLAADGIAGAKTLAALKSALQTG